MITRDLLVTGGFNGGYVPRLKSAVIQPVFAGANIAIRRDAIGDIGIFDNSMGTREDADLSLRAAKSKWLLFCDDRAVVQHKFRETFGQLLRQWFNYGWFHARVLAKHTTPGIEVFAPSGDGNGMATVRIPFPMRVFLPLSVFHVFHAALAISVIALLCGSQALAISSGLVATCAGIIHFLRPFPRQDHVAWAVFLAHRYLMNWALVLGGFFGGLKVGIINIEPTHDRNGLPAREPARSP